MDFPSASSQGKASGSLRQPLLVASSEAPAAAAAKAQPRNKGDRTPLLSVGAVDGGFGSTVADGEAVSDRHDSALPSPSDAAADASEEQVLPADPQAVAAAAADTAPPKPRWMRRAERCVRDFERRKSKQLRRQEWGCCTLAFPDEQQERMFAYYSAQLRERNMRGCMLLLAFAYCLYATVEWRDAAGYSLSISRGTYVAAILGLFVWSYARPRVFRLWLQEWTLAFCVLTSVNIIVEAVLLRAVYSPFVVVILLLFLLSSSVLVRLRFAYTSALCWGSLLLYDFICLVRFRHGDDYMDTYDSSGHKGSVSTAEVVKWLLWYNAVLTFTVIVVQKIAHRVEVQARYEFLTTRALADRRAKGKRARRAAREARRMQEQYAAGVTQATAETGTIAEEDEEAADESKEERKGDAAAAASSAGTRPSPLLLPQQPSLSSSTGATASGLPVSVGGVGSGAWADSDSCSSDSDGEDSLDEETEEVDNLLLSLDAESFGGGEGGGGVGDAAGNTLRRLNATLQRTLHDLLFTPATVRQRARIAAEDDLAAAAAAEQHSHHHHGHSHGAHSHGGSPEVRPAPATGSPDVHATRALPSRSGAHYATAPSPMSPSGRPRGTRSRGSRSSSGADQASSSLVSSGAGPDDPPVPLDQMSLITKALAESGVGDMGAFLRKLAAKPRVAPRATYATTTCDELPSWYLSYPNIIGGYRVNFSAQMCLQSLFKLHNETLNVWTEFLPAAAFFIAFFYILSNDSVLLQASMADRIFVAVGLFGAQVIRPIASGLAHLMYPQNERAYVVWWGIDYASICLSIFCTCAVFGRFAFYCLPDQQSFFYVSLTGLFLSTIVSVLFVSSNAVRTGSFLLFVLFSTGVPLWYTLGQKWAGGAANDVPSAYLLLWLVSLGCFAVGLTFKSSGFPESITCGGCIRPGTFDVWGGSHANWHLCINAGNALVYPIWRHYLQWRLENKC